VALWLAALETVVSLAPAALGEPVSALAVDWLCADGVWVDWSDELAMLGVVDPAWPESPTVPVWASPLWLIPAWLVPVVLVDDWSLDIPEEVEMPRLLESVGELDCSLGRLLPIPPLIVSDVLWLVLVWVDP